MKVSGVHRETGAVARRVLYYSPLNEPAICRETKHSKTLETSYGLE